MKELREQLLKSIAEKLAPFDFVLRKKEHHFRRKFEGGTHTVSVNFIPHPGIDFDFTGGVAIRFEAVEQLVEGLGLGPTPWAANLATCVELASCDGLWRRQRTWDRQRWDFRKCSSRSRYPTLRNIQTKKTPWMSWLEMGRLTGFIQRFMGQDVVARWSSPTC
jgi:hypothetical protein